jgi:hypothetical protein
LQKWWAFSWVVVGCDGADQCIAPHDKDAKLKMQECEKIVRRMDFLKAIEVGEPPSAAEGLDLNAMSEHSR